VLKEGAQAGPYATVAAAKTAGAITLNFGLFLNLVLNFAIVAFALFMIVKAMNAARRQKDVAPPPGPTREEVLLTEIRDLLQRRA